MTAARLCAAAAACAIAFVVLGVWVTHSPLSRIDVQGAALRGANVPLAIAFTQSGYGPALAVLGVGSALAAVALRMPLRAPAAIVLSELVSQGAVNLVKGVFARPRPAAWIVRHELGFSYPSGHATTAVVFYGAWLVVAWLAPLPLALRIACAAVLTAWIAGIGWSRIALGAHYPTDVIGGYLFGLAWLCAALALLALRGAGPAARHA